ncbi:MAG: hypothetical protein ACFCUT_13750 [Kiloniellaceae bacterium]
MTRILFAVLSAVRKHTKLGPTVGAMLAVLLAGCAGSSDAPRPMHIAARVAGETLLLEVSEIPPGREITAAVLVDAGGGETPARERELITREEGSGGNAGPGVGVGASGGSSSGIRPHISLGYLFRGDDSVRRSQRMTAEIPLTDPAAYAAGHRDWRIVLRYRDQLGEPQQVSVPAPAP